MPRWAKWLLGGVTGLLLLAALVLLVLTQTDYGRERVRRVALGQLEGMVRGRVEIGEIRGNLLSGATLERLVITDSAGGPFLSADRAYVDYSIGSLLSRRIHIEELRLERPVIVLDKPPGEEWNFARIFPSDTVPQDTLKQGFGSWVRIEDLSISDGNVLVRNEWMPDTTLAGAARDSAVRLALSPDGRLHVVGVAGGFQSIHELRQLHARLPLLRLADPDSSDIVVDVASLRTAAFVFRPPEANVRDLSGRLVVSEDSMWFRDLELALPGSRVAGEGSFVTETGELRAGLRAAPIRLADLQWALPSLPDSGGGNLELAVARSGERTRLAASAIDLQVEGARLVGHAAAEFGDSLRLGDTDLAFAGVDTRLVERLAPATDLPVDGAFEGHLRLAGTPARLDVAGWTTLRERDGATSRVTARGEVGTGDAGLAARGLRLQLEPLQLSLARTFRPDLPVGGAVTGYALLDGSTSTGFDVEADLVHRAAATGSSRLVADGRVVLGDAPAARDLTVRLQPVQLALVSAFAPEIGVGGVLTGRVTVDGGRESLLLDADVVHDGGGVGRSRLLTSGRVDLRETPAARGLTLRMEPVQLALVRSFAPDLPVGGTLAGRVTFDGTQAAIRVDADLVHREEGVGRSHLLVTGPVGLVDGFSTPGLRLRFDPLQVSLARAFSPDLPLGGTLTGDARVTGSAARVAADLDMVHRDVTGRSHLVGRAGVGLAEPTSFDVDVRVPELSLTTVGRFAPAAGLRGAATGAVRASGTLSDLSAAVELTVEGGGSVSGRGDFDLESERKRYDLHAQLARFDAAALSSRGPRTGLTGTVSAVGVGTEPATAEATLRADLVDTRVPVGEGREQTVEAASVLARLSDGVATVERGEVRIASAEAIMEGSFGLTAQRAGTLRYRVVVDSLSDFAALLPPPAPTDSVARDPAIVALDTAGLALDSDLPMDPAGLPADLVGLPVDSTGLALDSAAPQADAARLPLDAPGLPLGSAAQPDSVAAPIPADRLAGTARTEGTISGNLERFDLRGTLEAERVVVGENAVARARAVYDWTGALSPGALLTLEASAAGARVGGLALDSVGVQADHRGNQSEGEGSARVAVFQDPQRDYQLAADYRLSLGAREVRLDDVAVRFDTVFWRSAAPGAVRWGGDAIEVERIELLDGAGGRIFADGRLPVEGTADLRVEIDRLQIAQVAALLQDTTGARGLLSLRLDVAGTQADPVLTGRTTLTEAAFDDTPLPELHAAFGYADTALQADAALVQAGDTTTTAAARLPVNLALAGYEGPRLLDGAIAVDVRADSLALDALPNFTEAVSDVQGVVRGEVAVRGTFDQPDVRGDVTLDFGSLRIVEPGVLLQEVAGALRIRGDSLVIDSLVAHSEGPIRVAGTIDIGTLSEPGFDLALTAREAGVLNNELGTARADADLTISGPFEAVRVEGDIRVSEGTLYIPEIPVELIDLDDPALEAALTGIDPEGTLRPQLNPLLQNLQVDVGVQIARNTWVRNAAADVEIYTPDAGPLAVRLDNQSQLLTVEGTINVDRGEYAFSGRRFELTSGSVTFLGEQPIDPLLQIAALHEVPQANREPLTIQIGIGGYLSAPTVTLSSTAQPPMSESDLLSYLAFGEPSSSLLQPGSSGLSGGTGAGELGALATQQLAGVAIGALVDEAVSSVERSAGRAGLDVLRVSPADDLPEEAIFGGTFENILRGTEIEAGKYFTRRFYVSAQGRPTPETAPGVVFEYRTSQGFVLRTSWEPRYLPSEPTFFTDATVDPSRVFGLFLNWQRRF